MNESRRTKIRFDLSMVYFLVLLGWFPLELLYFMRAAILGNDLGRLVHWIWIDIFIAGVSLWSIRWIRLRVSFASLHLGPLNRKLLSSWWYVSAFAGVTAGQGLALIGMAATRGRLLDMFDFLMALHFVQIVVGVALLVVAFTVRVVLISVIACALMLFGALYLTSWVLREVVASV